MASRRLAISSLLCADDSDTPVPGPSSDPPESSKRAPVAQTNPYGFSTTPLGSSPRLSQTSPLTEVVPLSIQPVSHVSRRTPSPTLQSLHTSQLKPSTTMSRRGFREVAFDDYTAPSSSVTSPSANRSAVDLQDYTLRRQPQPNYPRYSSPQSATNNSYYLQERSDPHLPPERSYSSLLLRPSSSGQSDFVPSAQPTSFLPSPSHSPIIPYVPSHRQSSQSPDASRHSTHFEQPLSPRRAYRPSVSPLQLVHQALPPITSGSVFAPTGSPSHQTPQTTAHRSPTRSRHAISSLLTSSPPTSRASAASLPHILNSPVPPKSTIISSPSGNSFGGLGMEGLEALVQAATQERRRLDEEMTEEVVQASLPHPVSRSHTLQSPLSTPVGTVYPSPVVERDATFSARQSPVLVTEMRLSYESQQILSSSPVQPFRSPTQDLMHSPRGLVSSPVSPHFPASPSRQIFQAARPPDVVMADTETLPPPTKRRRSSERSVQLVSSELSSGGVATSSSRPLLVDEVSQIRLESLPLIGPGVAPPLEKAQPIPLDMDVDMNMSVTTAEESNRAEPQPCILVPVPHTSLQEATELATQSTHEYVDVKIEAMDIPVVLQPVVSTVPVDINKHEVKPKIRKKRSDAVGGSKLKEKEKEKEKEKAKERSPKVSRVTASRASPDPKSAHPTRHESKFRDDDTDDWFLEQFGEPAGLKPSDAQAATKSALASPELAARSELGEVHHKRLHRLSPATDRPYHLSSKRSQERRSRSPTPLAMLEAELEEVPLISTRSLSPPHLSPHTKASLPGSRRKPDPPLPSDMDLDTELERAVAGETEVPLPVKPKPKPKVKSKSAAEDAMDLDVEDELLKLLDDEGDEKDKKHRSHHSHLQPSISSTKKEGIFTATPTSLGAGSNDHRGRSRHTSKASKTGASGSVVGSPALGGSSAMPPPTSREVSQARESPALRGGKDEIEQSTTFTTAPTPISGTPTATRAPTPGPGSTSKSKEGSATAPKKKAPAKPKGKAATTTKSKPRLSAVKERSATPVLSPHHTPNPNELSTSTSKSKKTQVSLAAKRAVSAAGGVSRSRSTSVMPGENEAGAKKRPGQTQEEKENDEEKEEEEKDVDDRLYCVCRTSYDEDRVMIACDRCDEWYHTQCVNMPDLEVDLVDQFICPLCVSNNPHLDLRTTYKKRCLAGLAHSRPGSQHACHKPARGAFSKYCSDECGMRCVRERIEKYAKEVAKPVGKAGREAKEEGEFRGLWEAVKGAGRREGVVVRVLDEGKDSDTLRTEIVVPRISKHSRLLERLEGQISKISRRRDGLKAEEEIVGWRATVIDYAARRAERRGQCGWDGRLLWYDEEIRDFGDDVIELYDRVESREEGEGEMVVDGVDENENENGEWWCTGKKKCDRHAGWQKLRQAEVELERELFEAELEKLTTHERDLRRRIEDLSAAHTDTDALQKPQTESSHAARTGPLQSINGIRSSVSTPSTDGGDNSGVRVNGMNGVDGGKKGKKRKMEAR